MPTIVQRALPAASGSTCARAVARLSAGVGSGVAAATVAVFSYVPVWTATTVIVTLAVAPAARLPRAHVTVWPESGQVPCEGVAPVSRSPVGRVSETSTSGAGAPPLFETSIVYVNGTPTVGDAGVARFEIVRSKGRGATERGAAAVLFDGFGSPTADPAVAVLVTVWSTRLGWARTVISRSRASPAGSVPTVQVTVGPAAAQPALALTSSSPVGSVSTTCTSVASCGPPFRTVSRKLPVSPTVTGAGGPVLVSDRSALGSTGVNETRASLLAKLGSKLKTPVTGRVLLESARLSTWVPALSGASVLSIVITRSSPGPSWGISQATIGDPGAEAEALPGRVVLDRCRSRRRSRSRSGASAAPPAGCRPPPCPPFRARRCGR